ncbi:toprim domain-containing protein, partial [Acinetobacter baumannii]
CGETVYLVEGEKDVNTLRGRGIVATTCAMGADHWEPTYTEQLAGCRSVVIVADRDEAGYKAAVKKAAILTKAEIPVRVVEAAAGKD